MSKINYIHLYLDNALKDGYKLIPNVKQKIFANAKVKKNIVSNQLVLYEQMRQPFMTADYLGSKDQKEFERKLKEIIEKQYELTHTNEGRLDIKSVQSLIKDKQNQLNQLKTISVELEQIILMIEEIRTEAIYKDILHFELAYAAESGETISVKVPDGLYSKINQNALIRINQKMNNIKFLAQKIQGSIPKAYAKLTGITASTKKGDKITIENIFNSFQGYESAQRGLLYELSIYCGFLDEEEKGLGSFVKAFSTGKMTADNTKDILDSKFVEDYELARKIKKDVQAFINGYKTGQGKSDLTLHVFGEAGSFRAIEMVSIKDSVFSALHPDYGNISLGGSAKLFSQMLGINQLSELLGGQDPKHYALQTFTGLGGSSFKGIPRPGTRQITAPKANESFKSLVEAAGILNFIDYLVGSGRYGDFATYFAVNGKLYKMEDVLYKALMNPENLHFKIPSSLQRSETKAKQFQMNAFVDGDDGADARSANLVNKFDEIFSGMISAKIRISTLNGLEII